MSPFALLNCYNNESVQEDRSLYGIRTFHASRRSPLHYQRREQYHVVDSREFPSHRYHSPRAADELWHYEHH